MGWLSTFVALSSRLQFAKAFTIEKNQALFYFLRIFNYFLLSM